MDELEKLIRVLRNGVETEWEKYQNTDAMDVADYLKKIRELHRQCRQQIQLVRVENIGRYKIQARCEQADIETAKITTQALNDAASGLGRRIVAA